MSLANSVEERIKEAIANGEFDNLEGAGKPLNFDDYFAAPEDVRMGYSVLKSNKFVPEEIDRLKEIGELKEQIKRCADENQKRNLIKVLNEKTLAFNLIMERNRRK
jgi:hypothetical protein